MMPNLPPINNNPESVEVGASSSPFTEDSVAKTTESDVTFEGKPQTTTAPEKANEIKLQTPKKGIEVVATRKGFYNQNRLRDGDKFYIKSPEDFGDWFRCTDPLFEKERVKFLEKARRK